MHIVSIIVKQKLLQFLIANLVLLGLVQLCHPSEHFPSCKSSMLDLTYTLHKRLSKSVLQYTHHKILYVIWTADKTKFINDFVQNKFYVDIRDIEPVQYLQKNHPPCLTYVSLQLSWSVANLHIQCDAIPCGMEYYAMSKHGLRPTAVHAYNPW